jgi:hypothetical protein
MQYEKRIAQARDDLSHVNACIAIFEATGDAPEFYLRCDQVAERVALDCEIATEAPDVAATLSWRVKATLDRKGKRGLADRLWQAGAVDRGRVVTHR